MIGAGLNSQFVSRLQQGNNREYLYDTPKAGLNVTRRKRVLNPTENSYTSDRSGPMRFRIPNDKPIDFRRSYIRFRLTITATAPTFRRMQNGVWSIVDRFRHYAASVTIDERHHYNEQYSLLWAAAQDPDVVDTLGTDLVGIDTRGNRNIAGAALSTEYVMPMDFGFLHTGVVPFNAFGASIHEVEMYLAPANQVIETDGTVPDYTLTDIEWHVDEVSSWDGSYEKSLAQMVQRGQYQVWFQSWSMFQSNLLQTTQDLIISQRNMSINAIMSVLRDLNTQFTTTVFDKMMNFPKGFPVPVFPAPPAFTTITQAFQLKVAGKWIPDEEIDTSGRGVEGYMEYVKWVGAWFESGFGGVVPPVNLDSFNELDFFMISDFRNNRAHVLNNFSTETAALDIIFKIRMSAPPPAGAGLLHFINYATVAQVLPDGGIEVRN